MGMIGMAFGLGFILGPAIGGSSKRRLGGGGHLRIEFRAGVFYIEEKPAPPIRTRRLRAPNSRNGAIPSQFPNSAAHHTVLSGHPDLTCFESTLPLLMDENFHYDRKHFGYLFAYCGTGWRVIQGGPSGGGQNVREEK